MTSITYKFLAKCGFFACGVCFILLTRPHVSGLGVSFIFEHAGGSDLFLDSFVYARTVGAVGARAWRGTLLCTRSKGFFVHGAT